MYIYIFIYFSPARIIVLFAGAHWHPTMMKNPTLAQPSDPECACRSLSKQEVPRWLDDTVPHARSLLRVPRQQTVMGESVNKVAHRIIFQ